ncbi:Protein of unknown function DUF2011 [Penicillium atrosanguineum]|uniref:Uncharacterized protein n=1 Tax=Penicillium atrosanguineum TaxID=1132637 RepID=A0A9W9PPC1_9EURO|nr:FAD binding domain protein [Penicillium atrosanguineum]KAJ5125681.1 Protein of unknown function DUF2011 [Penicillium atrosanguineum]KAJ5136445.1 Protein of unknown function DUF2011 [Penicillium atrosanguineum]KAJ5292775.1 FAD binding domain protein [Penicillium atrosanguineum]KAJ5303185.1 Protein of unknown function DUF2011 [Penicillium atrosanguineum]
MFDLPNAKRVRRDEVQSPASSRSPSPVDESAIQDAQARLGQLLNLDALLGTTITPQETKEPHQPAAAAEDEEQEFEFRLFSAPAKAKDTTTKAETEDKFTTDKGTEGNIQTGGTQKLRIRLRSPSPANPSEGRFVKAFRGWQYYFSAPSLYGLKDIEEENEVERRRQFEEMAVSGEHITTWAKSQPWPGCHLPWRVTRLKRHQTKLPPKSTDIPIYVVEGAPSTKSPLTRKKPGKKRRVQLRKKVEAAKKTLENEAEKRTRKNRERKLKRRQKAREEKAAKAAANGEDISMVDADGDSSGSDE